MPPMEPTTTPSATIGADAAQSAPRSRHRTVRKLFFRTWLALGAGFLFYLHYSYRASGFPLTVLETDARVAVTFTPDAITFVPTRQPDRAALIFIPGAMVEPTAYAPLARSVAERGHTAVIIKLPWRMASSESQRQSVLSRVDNVIQSGARSTRWVVAGRQYTSIF